MKQPGGSLMGCDMLYPFLGKDVCTTNPLVLYCHLFPYIQ